MELIQRTINGIDYNLCAQVDTKSEAQKIAKQRRSQCGRSVRVLARNGGYGVFIQPIPERVAPEEISFIFCQYPDGSFECIEGHKVDECINDDGETLPLYEVNHYEWGDENLAGEQVLEDDVYSACKDHSQVYFSLLMDNSVEDHAELSKEFGEMTLVQYQQWIIEQYERWGEAFDGQVPTTQAAPKVHQISTMGYKEAAKYTRQDLKAMGIMALVPDVDVSDMLREFGIA